MLYALDPNTGAAREHVTVGSVTRFATPAIYGRDLRIPTTSGVAVVRTSGFEGVPNIFLEAWAHGTPALTLNHDPDGIITRHGLGGHAEGQLNRLIDLASHHWRNRDTAHERAHHYRTYVQTQHSPTAVAAAWARALHIDDGAAPQPQTATT